MPPVAKKRQGSAPAKTPTKKVKKENGAQSAEKEALVDKGLLLQYANKVLEKFDEIAESGASLTDWLLCTIQKQTPVAWCDYYDATYKATLGVNYLTERELADINTHK